MAEFEEFKEAMLDRMEMAETAITNLAWMLQIADLSPRWGCDPEDESDFHEAKSAFLEYCNDICDAQIEDRFDPGVN